MQEHAFIDIRTSAGNWTAILSTSDGEVDNPDTETWGPDYEPLMVPPATWVARILDGYAGDGWSVVHWIDLDQRDPITYRIHLVRPRSS
ncbi:MAG: hypothetical protein JHD16_00480 [Solirubrobacteraceae bacterium]|nr:hypothetical protein [Solirubrobacteraceae bacterium]